MSWRCDVPWRRVFANMKKRRHIETLDTSNLRLIVYFVNKSQFDPSPWNTSSHSTDNCCIDVMWPFSTIIDSFVFTDFLLLLWLCVCVCVCVWSFLKKYKYSVTGVSWQIKYFQSSPEVSFGTPLLTGVTIQTQTQTISNPPKPELVRQPKPSNCCLLISLVITFLLLGALFGWEPQPSVLILIASDLYLLPSSRLKAFRLGQAGRRQRSETTKIRNSGLVPKMQFQTKFSH